MNQGKIRILGIAPYEGMKSIMLKLAKDRDDIDLSVFVGDLHKGAEIARKNFHEDFDIIISRGGTAELIGAITPLPVIEIALSVYDILRAIKMAENFPPAMPSSVSPESQAAPSCSAIFFNIRWRSIQSTVRTRYRIFF